MKSIIRFFATFLRSKEIEYAPGDLIWVNFNYRPWYRHRPWYPSWYLYSKKKVALCRFVKIRYLGKKEMIALAPIGQKLTIHCEKAAVMGKATLEEHFVMIMEEM